MNLDYNSASYRIRVGTYSEVEMTEEYEISQFPQQEDQPDFMLWHQPVDPSSAVSEVEEVVDAFDGSRGGYGGYKLTWTLVPMTPGMVQFIRNIIFENNFTQTVTIMTWSRSEGWIVLNCMAIWNVPAQTASPGGMRGYLDFKIDFIEGEIAPYGRQHSRGHSSAFA